MPYVWFLVVCSIWGSSFILMKRAMLCLPPMGIGAGRSLGGAVVLGIMFLLLRRKPEIRRHDFWPLLGVVALGFAWPHSIQPALVTRIGSAFVGMTVGMTPLLTILVSVPMLGVWPTPRQVVGVFGALVCMAVLMQDGLTHHVAVSDLLLAISVPTTYSIANSLIRRSLRHLPPLELTLMCLLLNSSVLVPLSILAGGPRTVDARNWPIALAAVAILGIVGTGIATLLFNKLVHDQGPLFASMTTNLVPVGAVLWGWAEGELISSTQVAALIGILLMVTIVQIGPAQHLRSTVVPKNPPDPSQSS
jgi:drug/metabolite transporter (DMT)-like permease